MGETVTRRRSSIRARLGLPIPGAWQRPYRRLGPRYSRQDPITQRQEKRPPPRGARCAQAPIVYAFGGVYTTKAQLRATLVTAALIAACQPTKALTVTREPSAS